MTPIRIVAFLFLIVVLFSSMVVSARPRGRGYRCPPVVGCDGRTDNIRWGKRSSTTLDDIRNAAEMLFRRRLETEENYPDDLDATKRTSLSLYDILRSRDFYR
ncbi:hypothetical protein HOLleu_20289 [Holothuria leucospilota]|uniref:Uncharacterized protein n=1 Tax=Holothuria leucospilota TaxID=206669 RepID=A0A9Q1C0V3_HOLLE|nr:hypothetical protein HOLleu_20289 [Holothuria leucospilota]